jgi:hypothetical protein
VPYRELFISSRVPRESCPSYGPPPPLEPYMEFGTEMDEEITAESLDLEPPTTAAVPPEVEAEEAERAAEAELPEQVEPPPPPPEVEPSPEPEPEPEPPELHDPPPVAPSPPA